MKFNIIALVLSTLTVSSICFGKESDKSEKVEKVTTYSSDDFFAWRDKLKKENYNPFKAAKFCKTLIKSNVVFESKIININSKGDMKADMDYDILSVPEIDIYLKDKDNAEELKVGQTIKYKGVVTKCEWNRYIKVLFLSVSSATLELHI